MNPFQDREGSGSDRRGGAREVVQIIEKVANIGLDTRW